MASKDYCPVPPPVFTGENYQSWAVKMTAYLQAWDLWEAVAEDLEIDQLPENPTMQQIKTHKEKTTKKFKAKTCLYLAVSESLFTRIMNLETAFHIWQYLKTEFQGNARTKSVCILNLRRELELQKMKDSETVKEYVDRLLDIINKLRLLERFEAKISALEEVRDLTEISLAKLLNALHAQEQRRQIIEDGSIEVNQEEEEQLFVASCYVSSVDSWLVDSGCTNHMSNNIELFKVLDKISTSKVCVENGEYISAKGKGSVAIESISGTKVITDVLYVLDIDQNLLSMASLEKEISSCNACQFGKQIRLPFAKIAWRASQKLQLVHTDLGGFKSEVAGVFYRFKTWAKNQSKCKMMVLRSDNGKEYTSYQFNKFCEEARIEHQLTTPYTPQQNGVSERKNRTIMEMTRCLLHEKNLPKKFWAEAANTVIFLLNRLPTKALQKQTPYKAWYGHKPSIINLKVFGCFCFSYIPQVKRDKLDKKSEPGIFIGYSSVSKAYKIFQPQNEKIIISRDVFMEEDQWNWSACDDVQHSSMQQPTVEDVDEQPVRGTQLLYEIYARCNVALFEPASVAEAMMEQKWKLSMEEEMQMIEKNQT
ncbi:uncharacterized protein LOC110612592 [Manihot esculenta]|uniref:uncharacterized protein LOC110612592 n=1 Tax=Manihot esculenta TaxID=3983 RepID=UPI000B5D1D08|nr:uncharacterized protein LOC110612592 [Manihot esculenta]